METTRTTIYIVIWETSSRKYSHEFDTREDAFKFVEKNKRDYDGIFKEERWYEEQRRNVLGGVQYDEVLHIEVKEQYNYFGGKWHYRNSLGERWKDMFLEGKDIKAKLLTYHEDAFIDWFNEEFPNRIEENIPTNVWEVAKEKYGMEEFLEVAKASRDYKEDDRYFILTNELFSFNSIEEFLNMRKVCVGLVGKVLKDDPSKFEDLDFFQKVYDES